MQVIYGINPLLEIFHSDPAILQKIVIAEGRNGEAIRKILRFASDNGIPVEFGAKERLEKLAPRAVHQGVVGLCREYVYASVDDVIAHRHPACRHDLVLILDSVTDPQNLGSIIRTAHCFGANGVIIPEDRAATVTAAVLKSSAGAAHHLPTARVVNLVRTIEELKQRGFWIYGADAEATTDIRTPDYTGPVALVMGSEGQGIRPLIRKKCDFLIAIPLRGEVASLNVAVATGVILYEISANRGKGS
jgi:23S rRNA (guanosine2251-2'-O)-methyltransferase